MSTLTNEDFRKLLATPRRDGDNTEQKTYSKLSKEEKLKSLKNEIRKEDNRKKQKHSKTYKPNLLLILIQKLIFNYSKRAKISK